VQGVLLVAFPENVSTATWHARLVGIASLAGALGVIVQSYRWFKGRSPRTAIQAPLGMLLGATACRAPMVMWRASRNEVDWSAALNGALAISMFVAGWLALWLIFVFGEDSGAG